MNIKTSQFSSLPSLCEAILLIFIIVVSYSHSYAASNSSSEMKYLDNFRKGWFVNICGGGGLNILTPKFTIEGNSKWIQTSLTSSLITDVQLGFNFNNSVGLSAINRFDWQMPYSTVIGIWTSSLNIRYYLKQFSPSFFLDCSFGGGYWFYPTDPIWNKRNQCSGISSALGFGYELKNHFIYKLEYQSFLPTFKGQLPYYYTSVKTDYSQLIMTNSIRFSIGYTFY